MILRCTIGILIALFSTSTLFAEKVLIQGKIKGSGENTIGLIIDKTYLGDVKSLQTQKMKAGGFRFEIDLERNQIVTLDYQGQTVELYVEPGDLLELQIPVESQMYNAKFSGKGAANNTFLTAFNLVFAEDYNDEKTKASIQAFSIDAFENLIFGKRKKQWNYYKESEYKNDFTNAFSSFIEKHIKYYYLSNLFEFAVLKPGEVLTVTKLPDLMVEDIDVTTIQNDKMLMSQNYRKLIANLVTYESARLNNFEAFENISALLERKYNVALKLLKGTSYGFVLAKNIFDYCELTTPSTLNKLHTSLVEFDKKGLYKELIEKKCLESLNAKEPEKDKMEDVMVKTKKTKSKSKVKKEYPFEILDLEGKKVSFDDFRGKVIYVDFWASWCGPCRQQFPHAKALKEMLSKEQKKQIVFLYISIDSNDEKWRSAIKKFELEGVQVRSPGGWGASAPKYFGVSSIPRYMIVDKKGNVIDTNAKRPSAREALLKDLILAF